MSILDTIEKIQKKPEHTRRQIMYVSLIFCMLVVFGIWAVNFRNTLSMNSDAPVADASSTSPLDYLKNAWSEITNKINGGEK